MRERGGALVLLGYCTPPCRPGELGTPPADPPSGRAVEGRKERVSPHLPERSGGFREGNPRAYTFIYKSIGWPSLAQDPKVVDPCSTLSPTTGIINLANPGNRLEFHCGFNLFSVITNGVNLLVFVLSIPISSVKRSFILARFF